MEARIDFVLGTCPGIPKAMWIASSVMIDMTTSRCWRLLAPLLVIKMLGEALSALEGERLGVRAQLRALGQAVLLAFYLAHYKPLLMGWDRLVASLGFFEIEGVLIEVADRASEGANERPRGWIALLGGYLQGWVDCVPQGLFVLSHKGAIALMRYIRAVSMLISAQLGPLAALISLLPGPFKRGFSLWVKTYVELSCWHIVLSILQGLTRAFTKAFEVQPEGVGATLGYMCLSLVLWVGIFLTPVWTQQLVSGGAVGGLLGGVGMLAEKLGRALPIRR